MSENAYDDPTGPAAADEIGDVGNGGTAAPDTNGVDPDADPNTDLMRADEDPSPDAQVPGAGPDGQASTAPA